MPDVNRDQRRMLWLCYAMLAISAGGSLIMLAMALSGWIVSR